MRSLKVISPEDMVDGEWYRCLLGYDDEWWFQFSHLDENVVYTHKCYSFMDDGYVFSVLTCRNFCDKRRITKNSLRVVDFNFVKEKFNIL